MELRIALLQLEPPPDLESAVTVGEEACRRAAALGADLAVFPEMWSNGYALPAHDDPDGAAALAAQAIASDGPYMEHFRVLARELDLAIAVTYLEKWRDRPRNTVTIVDRHGDRVLTYAKVHTCEFDAECHLTPGDGFPVADLDTRHGSVRIGAMICYDREFPEPARILMLGGAEVVVVPNACELEANRLAQFRGRAFENVMALAMANYAGSGAGDVNGHSIAFDGMAFTPAPPGGGVGSSRDMTVVEAGSELGVFIATIDLDALRRYRAAETMGNAYRRPRLYGALVDERVSEPFVRDDATR
jgi:N-carbamoylputrescine amidase